MMQFLPRLLSTQIVEYELEYRFVVGCGHWGVWYLVCAFEEKRQTKQTGHLALIFVLDWTHEIMHTAR